MNADEDAAVRAYITLLRGRSGGSNRALALEDVEARLRKVEKRLASGPADPVTYVTLVQEQITLHQDLLSLANTPSEKELEMAFVMHAAEWSEAVGIGYAAWREIGVPAAVLKAAGIARTRMPRA